MLLRRVIDNGDGLTFVAENTKDFPSFTLPYSEIYTIFRVVGVLITNI